MLFFHLLLLNWEKVYGELFKLIAEKFINPSKDILESFMSKDEIKDNHNKVKLMEIRKKSQTEVNKQKQSCCI